MSDSQVEQWTQPYSSQATTQRSSSPDLSYSPSSTSSSVFSSDCRSSQSSAPSSLKTTILSWDNESNSEDAATTHRIAGTTGLSEHNGQSILDKQHVAVAPQLRLHPRRTCQKVASTDSIDAVCSARQPPNLVRQCDRKDNFVESLVDTTTQMIEVIWPLSVVPCGRDAVLGGKNLIGLRTFIQEVLKRSKTSYSTLQVALYYLVLIRPHIPKVDFTKVQTEDTHAFRAMQCGRRMFLAALILASKYLQDRNYSARAWSKISGLKTPEINFNEIAFVKAIDWRLHVPEARFQRWTDIVLRYSQSSPGPSLGPISVPSWRAIIPHLTPDLEDVDVAKAISTHEASGYERRPPAYSMSPPRYPYGSAKQTASDQRSVTRGQTKPTAMEPPFAPSPSHLLTPQMTPATNTLCAPTVSSSRTYQGPCAIKAAIKQIDTQSMLRSTLDRYPNMRMANNVTALQSSATSSRGMLNRCAPSFVLSPESMVSDTSMSSRTSRSSSVSSISSAGTPQQVTRLAAMANHRYAAMQYLKKDESFDAFSTASPGVETRWTMTTNTPGAAPESFERGVRDQPHLLSVPNPINVSASQGRPSCSGMWSQTFGGRKRGRSSSGSCSNLEGELSLMLKCPSPYLDKPKQENVSPRVSGALPFVLDDGRSLMSETSKCRPSLILEGHESRKRICYAT